MKSEEILEAAQKNKQQGYEYEKRVSIKSNLLSSLISLLVGILLFLLEYFVNKSINIGLIAIGMTGAGVQALYEGITTKKLRYIIPGIIYVMIAILFILGFIYQVVLA